MTGYYCEKCNILCSGRQCTKCGKNLPSAAYRDVWHVVRVPASDGIVWKPVLLVLLSVTVLLLVFTAVFCLMNQSVGALLSEGTVPVILSVIPAGIILTLIVLVMQGREDLWYTLESTGAREQTWHRPSRLHSWSRLQTYRAEDACSQPDGTMLTLSKEKAISWKDVCQVKLQPNKGRILLYHTPHVAPLTLRIPAEEYNEAEALIKKVCKKVL